MKSIVGLGVAAVLFLGILGEARADDLRLSGRYSGKFRNSRGECGPDSLEIRERHGKAKGVWDNVAVTVRRVDASTFAGTGCGNGRLYDLTIRLCDGGREATVTYRASYREAGEQRSYTGTSRMRLAD